MYNENAFQSMTVYPSIALKLFSTTGPCNFLVVLHPFLLVFIVSLSEQNQRCRKVMPSALFSSHAVCKLVVCRCEAEFILQPDRPIMVRSIKGETNRKVTTFVCYLLYSTAASLSVKERQSFGGAFIKNCLIFGSGLHVTATLFSSNSFRESHYQGDMKSQIGIPLSHKAQQRYHYIKIGY